MLVLQRQVVQQAQRQLPQRRPICMVACAAAAAAAAAQLQLVCFEQGGCLGNHAGIHHLLPHALIKGQILQQA